MKYAEKTAVSSSRSRADIEECLMRYGASGFMSGITADKAVVAFECDGRRIKFVLPMPDRRSQEFTHTPARGIARSEQEAASAYEQAVRQRWRALYLVIKAKLEAVETGIAHFEDEFMAHIVLPNGETMSQHARPLIARAYETGNMPPLLGFDG